MSENQKALATVVTVLSSIQEEVRSLSITIHNRQNTTITLAPPVARKKSSERSVGGTSGERSPLSLEMDNTPL